MRDLVALDIPAGPGLVRALLDAWAAGDAVLPVDQRLPTRARKELVTRLGATVVVSGHDRTAVEGMPVETGDALVVATSGSTGTPKGVVLTHDAVVASAHMTSVALAVDPARDRWLACLPVSHIGGLAVITRALVTDTPLVVLPGFDAGACEAAAREGATLVSLVVATLGRIDAELFRAILLGGSAIPENRPENTVATYGMTETGSGIVYEGYPLDGVELRIVDGQVEIRSPTLLRCYRDETVPLTTDGWFPTGDAGAITDGRLTVYGRIGDVVVTGGEKVWPVAVEREMRRLPWVSDVAVVGRPDPSWGQITTAIVVPALGASVPALEALRDQLSDSLPRYALPRALEIVERLPHTTSGKVDRRAL